ncbi:MAG: ABC transporter ATP-binding protein, partial [Lachnospiraceae bacterium]|nr:ABC transporter ATP-binding protein [Lachnospiraceae bacterium]
MLKKISYVLDNRQKRNLFILLIVILVGAFVELLGVSSILPIVNVALEPETIEKTWYLVLVKETMGFTDARQMLVFLALMLIVIYIVKNIYITVMYSLQYRFIFNNQKRLAVKMMDCYMRQNYIFHVSKNVAELQRNVTNDVNGFFTVVLNALQFLAEFSVCAFLSIFLLQSDVITTLAVAGLIMIFGMLFTFVFKRVLVQKGERNRELNVQTTKWILQSFSGIKEIKVANSENFFIHNYDKNYSQF